MSARESILAGAQAYGLVPKTMRVRNFSNGQAWTKNQCQVNFYRNHAGETVFTHDGSAKAAYQLGLNILHDGGFTRAY